MEGMRGGNSGEEQQKEYYNNNMLLSSGIPLHKETTSAEMPNISSTTTWLKKLENFCAI